MNLDASVVSVKNPNQLLPRSGHKIVTDDSYIYLIGGFVQKKTESISPLNTHEIRGEVWRLHFVYSTWEKLKFDTEIFTLAASHSATKHGDCIFITGGTGLPFGVNILNHIIVINIQKMTQKKYVFNPKDNISKNLPVATYGHSVTYVNLNKRPCLFLMGGTTGTTYHQEVYKVDLMSLETTLVSDGEATNAPRARYKHEAFLYGDMIYMLGGTTQSNFSFSLDQIHAFNIHTHTWNVITTQCQINMALRCPAMCQNGQYIYLTGGATLSEEISRSIYQLDLATLSWSTIGFWDRPCFFHDSAFVSQLGSVFMFGGVYCAIPAKRSNDLYQFFPPTGRIAPSLRDLAWKSVIDMVIKARNTSGSCSINDASIISQDLLQMGLPSSIINKIKICYRYGVTYAA